MSAYRLIIQFLLLLTASGSSLAVQTPTVVERAALITDSQVRPVTLPHKLEPAEVPASGGKVRYRLELPLKEMPGEPLGIYISRLSLAGSVYLNGSWVAACASGPIEQLRCLHRPFLFVPPTSLWRAGTNEIELELRATPRQDNGVTRVVVGAADELYEEYYLPQYRLRVSLVEALAWLSATFGLLSLGVVIMVRTEPVYFWFALCSLFNALSSVNVLVTRVPIDPDVFNWIVFSSRLISIPLLLLTFLSLFRNVRWVAWAATSFAVIAPVLVWLSGNSRSVVVWIYVPMIVAAVGVFGCMIWWTWRSRNVTHIATTLVFFALLLLSLSDWVRLSGRAAFDGMYLVAYGYGAVIILIGVLLMAMLVSGLKRARQLSNSLEEMVQQRTDEVARVTRQLVQSEVIRRTQAERDRILQDVHDGFGSQLATTRMLAERGRIQMHELPAILAELSADLHLVVDTLGDVGKTTAQAIADLRYRLDRRVAGLDLHLQWQIDLANLPALPQQTNLQLLRIAQEAIHNAMRHSGATHIWITARYLPAQGVLTMSVLDNGRGVDGLATQGKGLGNMERRVQSIGADLRLIARQPGTEVLVILPLAPHHQEGQASAALPSEQVV